MVSGNGYGSSAFDTFGSSARRVNFRRLHDGVHLVTGYMFHEGCRENESGSGRTGVYDGRDGARPAAQAADKADVADTQKTVAINDTMPKHTNQMVPRRTVQFTTRDGDADTASSTRPPRRVRMARLSGVQMRERVTLGRATQPAACPAVSIRREWSASASRAHDSASTTTPRGSTGRSSSSAQPTAQQRRSTMAGTTT